MSLSRPMVLIVDDSLALTLQLQQVLQQLGVTAQAFDPDSQTAAIDSGVAAIFVEVLQSRSNGFQILRKLTTAFNCPLILLSGTGRTSDAGWSRQAGAASVLCRPLTRSSLAQCLQQVGIELAEDVA